MNLVNNSFTVKTFYLSDDGQFPNNRDLPVLFYKGVLNIPFFLKGISIRRLLKKNGYFNFWKDKIYEYHHYHSNTHEVLVVCKGKTKLLLGGEDGTIVEIEKGDVIVLPAGVAHKNMSADTSIACIGAYSGGKDFDMNYGKQEERVQAEKNIREVPIPSRDPVLGLKGVLQKYWW